MDLSYLVNQIKGDTTSPNFRLRQGKVITVNSNRTIDIQIAGDTNTLPSVKYLSNYAPKPDDQTWLLNSGADLLAIGMVAGVDRTLAPVAYRTSALTITKDTNTYVSFEADNSDGYGCWTVGDPTKLTAPVTGRYIATASVLWEGQNGGYCAVFIEKGTQEIARTDGTLSTKEHGFHMNVSSVPITLTKGDYVRMGVHHDHNPDNDLIISSGGVDHTGYFNALSLIYLGS
jgi:hypothetical protein